VVTNSVNRQPAFFQVPLKVFTGYGSATLDHVERQQIPKLFLNED
jgi:hypothetical protein